jgi:hypothetical protein
VNASITTVEKLKSSKAGAIGQVITTGHFRYRVVGITLKGVEVVALNENGYLGKRSHEIPSFTEVWVENRQ